MPQILLCLLLVILAACSYSSGSASSSVRSLFPIDSMKQPLLPPGSRLIEVQGQRLHVRTMGSRQPGPLVVMLSGPTSSWHSDSAWFAALQPLLARSMRTAVIDRAGQAFSEGDGAGGYAEFAVHLSQLIPQLSDAPVFVVAFASANLALHHYFAANPDGGQIAAALLIDPDALHPELLDFYAEQAVPFKNPALKEYVQSGGYDVRAQELLESDRTHVLSILPDDVEVFFDQRYFNRVLATRTERKKIIARFTEISRYDQDVMEAAKTEWPAAVPVWVLDTDFELAALETAVKVDEVTMLNEWYDLSKEWLQDLAGTCWIHSGSREHLAIISEAAQIADLVEELIGSPDACREILAG